MKQEGSVDHTRLVDDEKIAIERFFPTPLESPRSEVHLEKSMEGECFLSRNLHQSFSCSTCGRSKKNLVRQLFGDPQNPIHNGAFSRTRPPCDDMHFVSECLDDRLFLFRGKSKLHLFLRPISRLDCVD